MLILASQSPARKTLLKNAGVHFSVEAAGINEREIEAGISGGAEATAIGLATEKARAVAQSRPDTMVIGADQVLSYAGGGLHKPQNLTEARAQLIDLRGKTHQLISAAVLMRGHEVIWSGTDTAILTVRRFSTAELDAVLEAEGDAILRSVGAYRLEGPSVQLFDAIEGSYFTILGLPLLPLLAALRKFAPQYLTLTGAQ